MFYSSKNIILLVRAVYMCWTMIFIFMFCYGSFEVSLPQLSMVASEYSKYQSNTVYLNRLSDDKEREKAQKLTDAQLTDLRLQEYKQEIDMEKRDGIQRIIISLIGGLIGVLMYIVTLPLLKIKGSD